MDFKQMAEMRRSVKNFDLEKSIPEETLKSIINLAVNTPSCFNLQPWELILIESKEAKKRLYENACRQKCILEAPVSIILIGDTEGFKAENKIWDEKLQLGIAKDKVQEYIEHAENVLFAEDEQKIKFAATNSSLFAMSLIYAAQYYGVDSQPMIGFNEEIVKMIYQIEDSKMVTMIISLGYMDKYKPMKLKENRRTYDEIVKKL